MHYSRLLPLNDNSSNPLPLRHPAFEGDPTRYTHNSDIYEVWYSYSVPTAVNMRLSTLSVFHRGSLCVSASTAPRRGHGRLLHPCPQALGVGRSDSLHCEGKALLDLGEKGSLLHAHPSARVGSYNFILDLFFFFFFSLRGMGKNSLPRHATSRPTIHHPPALSYWSLIRW